MYFALGLFAAYPMVLEAADVVQVPSGLNDGQVRTRAVTVLPTPSVPPWFRIARSPALSPFRFASVPLRTVIRSPLSYVYVPAMLKPLRKVLVQPLLSFPHGNS